MTEPLPGIDAVERLRIRTAERDALLDRVRAVLAADARVDAAWVFGSVGRGEADGFSDLDVAVVIDDDVLPAALAGPGRPATYRAIASSPRARFGAAAADQLLVVEAPQNAPPGGAFLSTFVPGTHGPHGIDWAWHPRSTAVPPADARLLFDRRGTAPTASLDRAPLDADDVPLDPFETAVNLTCSSWAMLLWSAKGSRATPTSRSRSCRCWAIFARRWLGSTHSPACPRRHCRAAHRGPLPAGSDCCARVPTICSTAGPDSRRPESSCRPTFPIRSAGCWSWRRRSPSATRPARPAGVPE